MAVRSINRPQQALPPLPPRAASSILKRIPPLWWLRSQARRLFFASLRHVATIRDSRDLFAQLLWSQNAVPPPPELAAYGQLTPPYPELRRERREERICRRTDVIFVTGRFRSGSTLIWNLFRNLRAFTSYYEPFNERRWFDPATRGSYVDASHVNVSNYWAEYDGLEALGERFSADWKFQHLYMPAHACNPAMQSYLEMMIEKAPGRPVLQFNEMDFRLPWLRARFPGAKILHIFRHPRDQWCSTLGKSLKSSTTHTLGEFAAADGFYLLPWGADLRRSFPLLTLDERSHPYELFYQIWTLSYLFGRLHADVSISFESIVRSPEAALRRMFTGLGITDPALSTLVPLVRPVALGQWRSYAAAEWFEAIEARVDQAFEDYAVCLDPAAPRLEKQLTMS